MMRQNFKAPWDLKLIIITTALILILGGLLFTNPGIISTVIVLAIILGCAAFGVYGYSIKEEKLKILRMGWAKEIDLKDITNVDMTPHAMIGSIRRFGIGGLFGYIGYYRNSILGSYKAYATNSDNTVLIETTNDGKVVVTPDDAAEFIEALTKRLDSAV
ncbi:MAG TPA: PH domain-containing protein [Fodinibius sp.]|nr:PH domain-containing protein [Fodinibius sp.]